MRTTGRAGGQWAAWVRAGAAGVLLAALAGCAEPAPDRGEVASPAPATSVVERGPVRLEVTATPGVVTVGDKFMLTVAVETPAGVDVELPELGEPGEPGESGAPGETLGPFAIRDARRPPDVPDGDRRRWTHRYTLDTFASGTLEIPPVTVRFVDRRPEQVDAEGRPIEGELATAPLTVEVGSVLAGDETETDFRDIKADVDVPVPVPAATRWLVGVATLVAIAALVVAFVWWRRRRVAGPPPAPVVPADVWAFRALDALAAAQLVERGEFHAFYVRLSDVVRQYLERRFGLMAPERTTEEFLREAGRSTVLGGEHRALLAGFLRAADLVKFALHEPAPPECHAAFASARDFVEQTRPTPETTGVDPGADTPVRTRQEVAS